jgi:5-methyltetrahydrofolate--homocysteine methyltransferase
MMLEGRGVEVVDLGVDVDPASVVEAVRGTKPDIVCLSALLTTTMMGQKETIDALRDAGLRSEVRILVGGAPVTQGFADEIGADGYAADAASAAEVALQFLRRPEALK